MYVVNPEALYAGITYLDKATGGKFRASDNREICLLTETELITSGCLASVLRGKTKSKALFCLKAVTECSDCSLKVLFQRTIDVRHSIFFLSKHSEEYEAH